MLATVISARCLSSRLPNKALEEIIPGFRAIDIVIIRAKQIGLPVILATSTDPTDDYFEDICKKQNIDIFRGALLNKIKRWYDCFVKFDIDFAIQIDGDDLSYDFDIAKNAIKEIQLGKSDLLTCEKEAITGLFTFAFTKNAIKKLYDVVPDEKTNTDIITKFIKKSNLKTGYLECSGYEKNEQIRLTLDYKEDLEFFKKLYSLTDIKTPTRKIIEFLIENPDVAKINYHRQKDFVLNQERFNNAIEI
tara:strand:- start:1386 stop:2129 length:744 start_codon:yes stop_codon:yes gene_type:complete